MSQFAARCLRALSLRATKNMNMIRQAPRRAVEQTRPISLPLQAPSQNFWLLLTTVFAASLDERDEEIAEPPPANFATTFESENVTTLMKVSELEALLADAGDKLVVIFCMVRWCPFCRKIAPTVEDIAAKGSQNLVMLKLDMDDREAESSKILARYSAYHMHHDRYAVGLPTFVFLKDGAKLEHYSSADDERLRSAVRKYTGFMA
ncbi:thioredoxin-like [Leguminivora glycinivorella]|uniref:thioredoxin-like n=1 Tax=Leguminivora glycinivorella TaxID=1035111 RepID=UPI00200CA347|nr:thioredoxin-like [Leguminivora glycinivorella]